MILVLIATGGVYALRAHWASESVQLLASTRIAPGPKLLEGVTCGEVQQRRHGWSVEVETPTGVVEVRFDQPLQPLPGAGVRCWGRFSPWRRSRDPGAYDPALAAARKGVCARFRAGEIRVVEPGRGPAAFLAACRRHWRQTLVRGASPERRGFFSAVLLGERGFLPPDQRKAFATTGAAHLLSISGLHVGMIVGAALLLMRLLGVSPRSQRLGGLACLLLYLTIVGPRVPTARAAIAGGIFLLLPGRGEGWNRLAVAMAVVLAWDPLAPRDVGFQLSFGTVAGMLACAPLLRGRGWRRAAAFVLVPFCASTPLLGICFSAVPPVALLLGAPSVLIFAVVLALGVSGLALGVLSPDLGAGVVGLADGVARLLVGIVSFAAEAPGASVSIPPPHPAWVLAGVGVLGVGLVRREHRRRAWPCLALAALLFLVSLLAQPTARPQVLVRNGGRTIIYDRGQGDPVGLGAPRGEPRWLKLAERQLGGRKVNWIDRGAAVPGLTRLGRGVVRLERPGGDLLLARRGARLRRGEADGAAVVVAPGADPARLPRIPCVVFKGACDVSLVGRGYELRPR